MERFEGRAAVVTGAGAGIGRAAALRLAAEGCRVVVTDIDLHTANSTAAEIAGRGGAAVAVRVDVADGAQFEEAVAASVANYGRVDVLVNNAGVAIAGGVMDLDAHRWQTVIDVNLRSVWLGMKAVIPHMSGGGAIVNMSSCQALLGFPGWAGYAATKGAIISLTRQAAVEYAPARIRVNCVAPGTIMTPMNERIFEESADREALIASWGRQHALGRFGASEEVAAVIAFLASDDASFVTGACVPVDGGMSILGPTG